MQTKGPPRQHEEERDIELENIFGNLMIAEYQVDKLRTRLSQRVHENNAFGPGSRSNKMGSVHVFGHNHKWYKVSVNIEELIVDKRQDVKEEEDVNGDTYSSSW